MHDTMAKPTRPIVRYHGGKWMLAPWIISHFPEHRTYVEPFCGGASVLIRKDRACSEVINDLDGELVNVFKVLRDPVTAARLRNALHLTPFAKMEFKLSYEKSGDPIEQARRTIARSFMGFGSNAHNRPTGFRANSSKSGTTPAHDWAHYPDELPAFVDRLRGVVIENKDAAAIMRQHDGTETLHYVDPPYVPATRDKGGDYSHEMTDDDHRELAKVLRSLKGMVILSGYPCEMYDRELFPDWYRVERQHLADGARKRTEVLWMNESAASRQTRQESLWNR